MDITFYINWLIVVVAIILIAIRKPSQIKKTVFSTYFIFLIITFLCHLYTLTGTNTVIFELLGSFWTYTAFAIVILHSSLYLGKKKTINFFTIALAFGLFSELILVKYGLIGYYYYNPILSPFIFGLVPVMTVVSWATIIHVSYTFANMIFKRFWNPKTEYKTE